MHVYEIYINKRVFSEVIYDQMIIVLTPFSQCVLHSSTFLFRVIPIIVIFVIYTLILFFIGNDPLKYIC